MATLHSRQHMGINVIQLCSNSYVPYLLCLVWHVLNAEDKLPCRGAEGWPVGHVKGQYSAQLCVITTQNYVQPYCRLPLGPSPVP